MRINLKFVLLFILFCFISGFYIYNHRLDLNPDGVSYINIAQFYKSGNFHNAINAYWSPVFSIFIILFSFIGDWLVASKLAVYISSILWFISIYLLAQTILKSRNKSLVVILFITVFPLSYEIWRLITPDLLFSAFLGFWLIFLIKLSNSKSLKNWFIFGILSGIGFLIKSYFLSFSAIFLLLVFILFKYGKIKVLLYFYLGLFLLPICWLELQKSPLLLYLQELARPVYLSL